VKPPKAPDDRASTDLFQDFGQMGFRIPAVAISPWSRNNAADRGRYGWHFNERWRVDHGRYGHESILSFLSYRFQLGFLTKRHATANNIGRGFNWWRPDFTPPELPDPPAILTKPCAMGGGDVLDSQQAHESDLAALESFADRHNVKVYDAKPSDIFTQPDTVQKAMAAAP
jgi:phospholipase C